MVHIVFLHPDLGIGGAERLVVDAALALKSKGHQIHIVTSHHDPKHCFPETVDGTIPVTVSGSWIPRSIVGRFFALCAYLKMIWAAIYVVFLSKLNADIFFCDQVSACIPVLRMATKTPVLFYCHFPDLLLASHKSPLQKLYRAPLDWLEEKTTGMATLIAVNSQFTAGIFHDTFKTICQTPQVIYPSLNFKTFDQENSLSMDDVIENSKSKFVYLSINRYERKKNLGLAIKAFACLRSQLPLEKNIHLIMAGGYDDRVKENVEHFEELKQLVVELELSNFVTFLRSPNDSVKTLLLRNCHCLLYTPDNEHFGIVPLEAMYCRLPVIAVSSGGPLETILNGKTGFLCDPNAEEFSAKMRYLFDHGDERTKMGQEGREHVTRHFSFHSFSNQLDQIVKIHLPE